MPSFRRAMLGVVLVLLAACARNDLEDPPVPLGDFALGLNIVVADNVQKVPISREASVEEWEAEMMKAVEDRFGRYQGNRLYNIGISVDGYALAPPGIPVIASPKSVLVITANIWDDATQTKLNPEGEQFHVFESLDGESIIGTGLTRNRKQQMAALSYNAVKRVEQWLLKHPEWFPVGEGAVPQPGLPKGATAPAAAPSTASAPAGTAPVATPLPPPQPAVPIPGPSLP